MRVFIKSRRQLYLGVILSKPGAESTSLEQEPSGRRTTEKQTSCKGMAPSKMQSECRLLAAESFKCMEKHTKETAKVISDQLRRVVPYETYLTINTTACC